MTIVAFFGGFAGWALLADLDSAVIAPGFAVVDSHRKTVQHLEGGILHQLLVREGDIVRAGQALAILDTTQADAQLGQLTSQFVAVEAKLARLRTEQQDLRTIEFPSSLTDQLSVEVVAEALETQRKLFAARWRAYDSSVGIIRKRIQQFREQIAASQSQSESVGTRLELMEEDLKNVSYLYERGYERRPRMLELRRSVQELRGQQAQLRGVVAEAQQSIAGAEMEIVNLGDARQSEVAKDLQDLRAQQADLADRIRAARDVRERRHIISPQDGVVTDVRLVTPGGVIGSGQPLMDIVPVDDELIIETRIRPADIDVVRPGLPARVRLTAFNRSTTPTIDGEVTSVSADMLTDPRDGGNYFLSRIKPLQQSLQQSKKQMTITPGMPAEVMIAIGERPCLRILPHSAEGTHDPRIPRGIAPRSWHMGLRAKVRRRKRYLDRLPGTPSR